MGGSGGAEPPQWEKSFHFFLAVQEVHGILSAACSDALDHGLELPGTEFLDASGTEPVCSEFLYDECDEGAGTYNGIVK